MLLFYTPSPPKNPGVFRGYEISTLVRNGLKNETAVIILNVGCIAYGDSLPVLNCSSIHFRPCSFSISDKNIKNSAVF